MVINSLETAEIQFPLVSVSSIHDGYTKGHGLRIEIEAIWC